MDYLQQGALEYNSAWVIFGGSPDTVYRHSGSIIKILHLAVKEKQWKDVEEDIKVLKKQILY